MTLMSRAALDGVSYARRSPPHAALAKLRKGAAHLWRQGPGGWAWLAYVAAIAPWARLARAPFHEMERRMVRARRRARSMPIELPPLPLIGVHAPVRLAELSPELEQEVAPLRRPGVQILLADIDQDGYALPAFAYFWDAPQTTREEFLPRSRFAVRIVDCDGLVGLRKEYDRDIGGMLNELEAAIMLIGAGLPVASILDVDFGRRAVTFSYIPGLDVRETLARAGARVRNRDQRATMRKLGPRRANALRIDEGRRHVERVLSPATIEEITRGLEGVHRAGVALEDVKYGNIVLERQTGRPYFVDFERAVPLREFSGGGRRYVRDRDTRKLVRQFGGDGLTAEILRNRRLPGGEVYAPAYFGDGIVWGQYWNPDIGVGRWRYLMAKNLPIPKGGRILDLGANNGFNALEMLRAGAASATAVEIDPLAIEQGRFLKRVYEWADNRPYDLTYVQGSHGALASLQLGRFDMVSAFCTLYYLGEAEMAEAVREIATMTDLLVLQCNTDRAIPRAHAETFRKASLEFNVALVRENGFPEVEVIAPRGYSRPLIIARKGSSAAG